MRTLSLHRLFVLTVGGIAIAGLLLESAHAQSSSRRFQPGSSSRSAGSRSAGSSSQSTRRSSSKKSFEGKLWDYLMRQKYQNWAPVPGQSDAAYPGESPHGAYLKMYLNRKAAGNVSELPDGSIVIKENYAADGKTLAAITVMYRTKGYNPAAGDWYWVKYNPDGTVAQAPPEKGSVRLAGKPKGCIECHGAAAGDDFAFFNDAE